MGVVVLGPHRSGTSAVTRVVSLLGVPLGAPLMDPDAETNPTGFWEVAPLADLDDELLARLGGSWDAPPRPSPGWADAPDLEGLRRRAHDVFRAAHPTRHWVWKDPRACVLFDLWRRVLHDDPLVVVLVLRRPAAVVASLERRNGFAWPGALAIWERSVRAAWAGAAGLPGAVVAYETLLGEPRRVVEELAALLDAHGERDPGAADLDAIEAFLRPELEHAPKGRALDALSAEQRELRDALAASEGAHEALPDPPTTAETPWVAPVVAVQHAQRSVLERSEARWHARLDDVERTYRELEDGYRALEAELRRTVGHRDRLERQVLSLAARLEAREVEQVALEEHVATLEAELAAGGHQAVRTTARRLRRVPGMHGAARRLGGPW